MARTVNAAFSEFNEFIVNVDTTKANKARASRDWLVDRLLSLPILDDDFPELYAGMHIYFGSFARKTKIRPLDDIDLIITFSAQGSTYLKYSDCYDLLSSEDPRLKRLSNDDGTINSRIIINQIVRSIGRIEHYKSADIARNLEAATLQLQSYEWNFDIVPAFYTDKGFYLIPNGEGRWQATDPRVDQQRATNINQQHNGKILQIIRTLKYWNQRPTMPSIPSYLFENIILNYFSGQARCMDHIDENIILFWEHLSTAIYNNVPDPSGLSANLNQMTTDERIKIAARSKHDFERGLKAYQTEIHANDQESAITQWGEIFGLSFPVYG